VLQEEQDDDSDDAEYLFAAQLTQLEDEDDEYVPARQDEQTVADETE